MVLIRRFLQLLLLLGVLTVGLFYLLHSLPGSPEDLLVMQNPQLSEADLQRIRELRGFDLSVQTRFQCWLLGQKVEACRWWPSDQGLLAGNLGYSQLYQRPVSELLVQRLPNSFGIIIPGMTLALFLALFGAILSLDPEKDRLQQSISGLSFLGLALPLHWVAVLMVSIFSLSWGWFPASGVESISSPGILSRIYHAFLPITVVTLFFTPRWLRILRASLREAAVSELRLALKARGLSKWQQNYHLLRLSLVPLLTVLGHSLPSAFSGILVIERVFAYPGMGELFIESILQQDYPLAMITLLNYAACLFLFTWAAELLIWLLDARVRSPVLSKGG